LLEITTLRTTSICCGIIGRNGSLEVSVIFAWFFSVPSLIEFARCPTMYQFRM
jgi:hypothetical protein